MKEWIENLKREKLSNAMKRAVDNYKQIEEAHEFLEYVTQLFIGEGIDLEDIIKNKEFNLYCDSTYIQLYGGTWKNQETQAEIFPELLMAATQLFGNGKRSTYGSDMIQYSWDNVLVDKNFEIVLGAGAAGCTIIEEEVHVPEKVIKAHTETRKRIRCGNME